MAPTVRFLAYSDPHCPLIDPQAEEFVVEQVLEHRPDVIVLAGDLFEADSASRWPSEYGWTLADEFRSANSHLKRIREVAGPAARCVFLPGNHDYNILGINRIDPKLRELCDWRNHTLLPEINNWLVPTIYEYHRFRGVYRLGQVGFSHGYECGLNGDELEALQMIHEFGLYVKGHTHRPVGVTQCMRTRAVPLNFWYANTGCVRDMQCEYMRTKRQGQWGQAVLKGDCELLKSPRRQRCWSAQLELFRKYED